MEAPLRAVVPTSPPPTVAKRGGSGEVGAYSSGRTVDLTKGSSARAVWTSDPVEGAESPSVIARLVNFTESWHSGMRSHISTRDPETQWSRPRKLCQLILEAKVNSADTMSVFDLCMSVAICYNVLIIVVATDAAANCDPSENCQPHWVEVSTQVLVALYTFELLLRLNVLRLRFVLNTLNNLDFVIVVLGYLDLLVLEGSQSQASVKRFSVLRTLRIIRVVRFTKILRSCPMLANMLSGFMAAMQAMGWGIVLILLMLLVWSIIVVELINPINQNIDSSDTWCNTAFTSVWSATLLFFQTIVAGDAWGQCNIPVILAAPWTAVVFAGALLTVQLGFMNLILAIIVDKAAERKEEENNEMSAKILQQWRCLAQALDADDSGTLSLEELMGAFEEPEMRIIFQNMSLTKEDVALLFQLMDFGGTGQVNYHDVVDTLHKAQVQDRRAYMMMIRLAVQSLGHTLTRQIDSRIDEIEDVVADLARSISAFECNSSSSTTWGESLATLHPPEGEGPLHRLPGSEQEPSPKKGGSRMWGSRQHDGDPEAKAFWVSSPSKEGSRAQLSAGSSSSLEASQIPGRPMQEADRTGSKDAGVEEAALPKKGGSRWGSRKRTSDSEAQARAARAVPGGEGSRSQMCATASDSLEASPIPGRPMHDPATDDPSDDSVEEMEIVPNTEDPPVLPKPPRSSSRGWAGGDQRTSNEAPFVGIQGQRTI